MVQKKIDIQNQLDEIEFNAIKDAEEKAVVAEMRALEKKLEEMKKAGPKLNVDEIVCLDADRPTTSQIKLLDTIVLQDSVKSVASVQVRGEENLLNIREGEKVENYEISRIQRMKLILKNLDSVLLFYLLSLGQFDTLEIARYQNKI